MKVLALPELCLTGYTCGDLFLQDTLLRGAEEGLQTILEATKKSGDRDGPWPARVGQMGQQTV